MSIILASTSPFRAALMRNAGLSFSAEKPKIDEREAEKPLLDAGATASDIAEILAQAKAVDVSTRHPGALVIGGDQTLSLQDKMFHKPKDMEEARSHLLAMRGQAHQLNSAVVFAKDGVVLWQHVSVANMYMRDLSPKFIGQYLARIGDVALQSVGAYQLEGEGIQLFEKIDGDYFTIVGLPLLPMLAKLRELGEIDG